MKQYEQQLSQITIEESASFQVENEIIRENNADMHAVHDKLSHVQYVNFLIVSVIIEFINQILVKFQKILLCLLTHSMSFLNNLKKLLLQLLQDQNRL